MNATTGRRVQPRDDLRALEGYHSPQVDGAVRLNTNESPYAPPPEFVARYLAALGDVGWNRYPDRGARDLRDALGAFLGQPSERLLCANGSNEVLQTLLLTYGGAGRRALMFEPTYALHGQIARTTATEVVTGERAPDYTIDVDAATELMRGAEPAVVFVCSPNNPTGTVESRDTIEHLLAVASETGSLLVVDEAYGEFAPWSAIEVVAEDRPLVVVRTYSKVWSLAAVRLGFAVAPTWVIADLEKVLLPYTLSVPTQVAGPSRSSSAPRWSGGSLRWSKNGGGCLPRSPTSRDSMPSPRVRTSCSYGSRATPTSSGSACSRAACSCGTSRRGRA
jgi:histidinol-phosphate aminotransferase